jgi:hypothetical protein
MTGIRWTPEECHDLKNFLRIAAANCPIAIKKYLTDIDKFLEDLKKENSAEGSSHEKSITQ